MYVHRQWPVQHCKPAQDPHNLYHSSFLLRSSSHAMPPHRTHLMACLHPQNTHATQQQPHHHHCHQCSAPSPQTLTYFAHGTCATLLYSSSSVFATLSSALARLPLLVCWAAVRIRFTHRPHPRSVPNCLPSNRLRCFRHSPASISSHVASPNAITLRFATHRFTRTSPPFAPLRSHLASSSPGSASTSAPSPGFCPTTRTFARRRDAAFPR